MECVLLGMCREYCAVKSSKRFAAALEMIVVQGFLVYA